MKGLVSSKEHVAKELIYNIEWVAIKCREISLVSYQRDWFLTLFTGGNNCYTVTGITRIVIYRQWKELACGSIMQTVGKQTLLTGILNSEEF